MRLKCHNNYKERQNDYKEEQNNHKDVRKWTQREARWLQRLEMAIKTFKTTTKLHKMTAKRYKETRLISAPCLNSMQSIWVCFINTHPHACTLNKRSLCLRSCKQACSSHLGCSLCMLVNTTLGMPNHPPPSLPPPHPSPAFGPGD